MSVKNKMIRDLIKKLEKKFGEGSLMEFDSQTTSKVDVISTGSYLLNNALGVQGYPKGRIVEIFGPESSGKTTMALLAISEVQKSGGRAAFIDVEHAIDPNHAKKLGVDLKNLIVSQPDSGEQAMEIVDHLVNSQLISLIVIDSVAALVPQIELDGSMSDQTIGSQARLISKSLRKMISAINKSKTVVIFINQVREKIGVFFGNPEVTPGGRALKFYSSMRIDIRVIERIKKNEEIIGQKMRIKVVKNKLSSPYKQAEINLYYNSGIDVANELFDLALEKQIIQKSGSWYSFETNFSFQGKEEFLKEFKLNLEVYEKIKLKLFNL